MTHIAPIPNRGRTAFLSIAYRRPLDLPVIADSYLGDVNHLEGIAEQIRGRICIDAGANIGTVTLKLLDLGARFVIAIEPEPENLALLRQNLALNDHMEAEKRVMVWEAAVGNPSRMGAVIPEGTGGSAIVREAAEGGVRVVSFAEVLAAALSLGHAEADETIAHCKVDVEGGEYEWFATARGSDLSRVDRFTIEFHGTKTHSDHLGPEDGRYGRLMTKLAEAHSAQAFGSAEEGGMIYSHSYLV